MFRKAAGGKCD